MAFKEISGEVSYPKFADFSDGDLIVEGKYTGEQEGKFGPQYSFMGKDGKVVLGKAGHLSYLLSQVGEGDLVQVYYEGQEVLQKGPYAGKSVHRFRVLVDDDPAQEELAF